MPIYGYRCAGCGKEFEIMQSMSDAPLKVCSGCGGALHKMLYPVGVQFKGSGFYSTDYKVTPKAAKDDGPAPASTPTAGADGAKTTGLAESAQSKPNAAD